MKVLIDLTSLADNFSGIERFALSITKELISDQSRSDIEYILVFKNEVHKEFAEEQHNVKKIIVRGKNKLIFNQLQLPLKLATIKADYYFFPAFPAPFFFFDRNAISAIHDVGCWDCPSKNKKYMTLYFKLMYRKAALGHKKVVTVSQFSKNRISKILKKESDEIAVIYDGLSDCFANFYYDRGQDMNGYQDLNIIYEHVDFMGLSKARNYALKMAHGDYFALIDDDAYYDERYLWEADKVLNDDREMILVGNIVQKSMLKKYSSKKQLKAIGYHQIMKNCPSPVLVFPYTLYCKGICFDENFGVGATFGACEETDLILEALDNKYQIGYCENMFVVHPTMQHSFEIENTTEVKKRENYARGLGALLEKDKVIRKNKRLHYYEMEKKCKILLKKTGLFGKKEKDLAIADLRGLNTGKRDFRKLLEKETYR